MNWEEDNQQDDDCKPTARQEIMSVTASPRQQVIDLMDNNDNDDGEDDYDDSAKQEEKEEEPQEKPDTTRTTQDVDFLTAWLKEHAGLFRRPVLGPFKSYITWKHFLYAAALEFEMPAMWNEFVVQHKVDLQLVQQVVADLGLANIRFILLDPDDDDDSTTPSCPPRDVDIGDFVPTHGLVYEGLFQVGSSCSSPVMQRWLSRVRTTLPRTLVSTQTTFDWQYMKHVVHALNGHATCMDGQQGRLKVAKADKTFRLVTFCGGTPAVVHFIKGLDGLFTFSVENLPSSWTSKFATTKRIAEEEKNPRAVKKARLGDGDFESDKDGKNQDDDDDVKAVDAFEVEHKTTDKSKWFRAFPHLVELDSWIQQQSFQGNVQGPIGTLVTPKDKFQAALLERYVPKWLLAAYIVDSYETEAMIDSYADVICNGSVSAAVKDRMPSAKDRPFTDPQMQILKKHYGVSGYLDEFLVVPPVVNRCIMNHASEIGTILVGSILPRRDEDDLVECLKDWDVGLCTICFHDRDGMHAMRISIPEKEDEEAVISKASIPNPTLLCPQKADSSSNQCIDLSEQGDEFAETSSRDNAADGAKSMEVDTDSKLPASYGKYGENLETPLEDTNAVQDDVDPKTSVSKASKETASIEEIQEGAPEHYVDVCTGSSVDGDSVVQCPRSFSLDDSEESGNTDGAVVTPFLKMDKPPVPGEAKDSAGTPWLEAAAISPVGSPFSLKSPPPTCPSPMAVGDTSESLPHEEDAEEAQLQDGTEEEEDGQSDEENREENENASFSEPEEQGLVGEEEEEAGANHVALDGDDSYHSDDSYSDNRPMRDSSDDGVDKGGDDDGNFEEKNELEESIPTGRCFPVCFRAIVFLVLLGVFTAACIIGYQGATKAWIVFESHVERKATERCIGFMSADGESVATVVADIRDVYAESEKLHARLVSLRNGLDETMQHIEETKNPFEQLRERAWIWDDTLNELNLAVGVYSGGLYIERVGLVSEVGQPSMERDSRGLPLFENAHNMVAQWKHQQEDIAEQVTELELTFRQLTKEAGSMREERSNYFRWA